MFAFSYLINTISSTQTTHHKYITFSALDTMARESPEIVAAGQPAPKTTSPAKKRKANEIESTADTPATTPGASEMAPDGPVASAAKKTASRGKKRKAADLDSAAGAPSKKMKKETTKPAAKPRQTKRTKKVAAEPPPPPAPSPVEVNAAVQAKIDAVKQFRNTEMAHEDSMLQRDAHDSKLVSIPYIDLVGVVMTMHFHYGLPAAADADACIADIEQAITNYYKAPLLTAGDVDWITLNFAIPTKLDTRIKEKIAHHGLDEVNLLEVEMELCQRKNRAQKGCYQWEAEKVMQTGDFLLKLVEVGWDEMHRKVEAQLMKEDGREWEKKGVCPAAAVEVA